MKKKILSAVVAAAALFGAYTAQQASEVAMNDLQVENMEMLAEGEDMCLTPTQWVEVYSCSYQSGSYWVVKRTELCMEAPCQVSKCEYLKSRSTYIYV